MSEPCVIRADYANWRPVMGRKVLQLILEVPIEQTAEVMSKLGVPAPGESKWVGVALLENEPARERENIQPLPQKDKRKFIELPYSQQAAIRCADPDFQRFLPARNETHAADAVRDYCGIASRATLDIVSQKAARENWDTLEAKFQAWLTDKRYAGARR